MGGGGGGGGGGADGFPPFVREPIAGRVHAVPWFVAITKLSSSAEAVQIRSMNYNPPTMSTEAASVSTRLDETPPSRPATNYAIESLHSTNDLFFQDNGSPETLDAEDIARLHNRIATSEEDTTLDDYEDTLSHESAITRYEMSSGSMGVSVKLEGKYAGFGAL